VTHGRGRRGGAARWPRAGAPALRCVLLCTLSGLAATAGAGQPLRRLWGAELRAAREARDHADRLRTAYEAKYGRPDVMPAGEAKAAGEVESAYRDAMARSAGSGIEASCGLWLAGFYEFRRQYDKASAQAEQVARDFAGTVHEMRAYFTVGLMHLQARHDPRTAIRWFQKIVPPETAKESGSVPPERYGVHDKLYLSAQMRLAKSEAMLGLYEEAKHRHEQLARRYPQYKSHIATVGETELQEAYAFRSSPTAKSAGNDRVQPNRLLDPVLRERVPLKELLGTQSPAARTVRSTVPPQMSRPAGNSIQSGTTQPPAASGLAPAGEPVAESRRRVLRILALGSALFAGACAVSLLFLHLAGARKETES